MVSDFVALFSCLGVERLSDSVLLLLIGGWSEDEDEDCFMKELKEASVVSIAWNRAVRRGAFDTKRGKMWLHQRSTECKKPNIKRASTHFFNEGGPDELNERQAVATALLQCDADNFAAWEAVKSAPLDFSPLKFLPDQAQEDIECLRLFYYWVKYRHPGETRIPTDFLRRWHAETTAVATPENQTRTETFRLLMRAHVLLRFPIN